MTDEELAALFHAEYERLAPDFSYETRKASAVPWDQVPDNSRRLMIAVAGSVRAKLVSEATFSTGIKDWRVAPPGELYAELVELQTILAEYHEIVDIHHANFLKIKDFARRRTTIHQGPEALFEALDLLAEIDRTVR
jgi:hypothetical protein